MVAVAVRAVPAGTADRVAPAAAEGNSRPWGQGGRAGGGKVAIEWVCACGVESQIPSIGIEPIC